VHGKLMIGVRGQQHATPGEFRRSQNWIGAAGATLKTATYIPPPPDQLMSCLDSFEKFLHQDQLPPLIQIGLAHYQFEAIHPFLDGNGRVGRLLIILYLIESKFDYDNNNIRNVLSNQNNKLPIKCIWNHKLNCNEWFVNDYLITISVIDKDEKILIPEIKKWLVNKKPVCSIIDSSIISIDYDNY
jgi:hypothetical protein